LGDSDLLKGEDVRSCAVAFLLAKAALYRRYQLRGEGNAVTYRTRTVRQDDPDDGAISPAVEQCIVH
jgi:hypothetical protein